MQQRLTIVGLGVNNLQIANNFYENTLGWKKLPSSNENISFLQLNGILLSLYPRDKLAEDAGVAAEGTGFKAFSLAYNTHSREEVDAIFADLESKGVKIVKSPEEAFWGGYSGYMADPDDNLWEIAYNPYLPLDTDGNVNPQKTKKSTTSNGLFIASGQQLTTSSRSKMKKLTITLITFCLSLSAFGQQTIRIDISQLDMTGFSRQDIFIRFDSFNRRLPTDEDIFTVEVKNLPTILELRTLKKRKFTSEKMFWIEQLEVPLQGSIAEKTLSISSGSPDLQIITDKIKSNFKPDPAREREMAYSKPVLVHLNRQRFFLKNDYLEKLISLAPPKVKEFWAFADLETYLKHQKAVGYNPDTKVFTHLTAINTEQNKQEVRLTGDKPILVDFSSTSCRPCLVDIPKMAAIHQEFSNQLDMLTVWNDPTYETWTRVAAQRKALIVWNSLWDKSGVIYKRFDIKVLPTYMLFDQDGKLLKTWHKPPRNIEKYL